MTVSADETLKLIKETKWPSRAHLSGVSTPSAAVPVGPTNTEFELLDVFKSLHRDRFRFVYAQRRWLEFRDGRWRRDETGSPRRAVKEAVDEFIRQASLIPDTLEQKKALTFARQAKSVATIRNVLQLAETEEPFVITPAALDANPFLLSCANGTIDLKTSELQPHDPLAMLSRGNEIAYNPNATCPRFLRFLGEIFDGNNDTVAFIQRAIGYSLTGDTREQVVFILHGAGCNGKTRFTEVLQRLLGDLAVVSPFDSFVRSKNDKAIRNDLARLDGARLVVASESNRSKRLDEAVVKQLTGGDTITTRFLYQELFQFRPQFKLWLTTNHRPQVDGADDAIWRRVRLIPFNVSFKGRENTELESTLNSELPGILAWAVQGCLGWQASELGDCEAVANATAQYRQEEDTLGAFFAERCTFEADAEVAIKDLRESCTAYFDGEGERPPSGKTIGTELRNKYGVTDTRSNRQRIWRGVRLT